MKSQLTNDLHPAYRRPTVRDFVDQCGGFDQAAKRARAESCGLRELALLAAVPRNSTTTGRVEYIDVTGEIRNDGTLTGQIRNAMHRLGAAGTICICVNSRGGMLAEALFAFQLLRCFHHSGGSVNTRTFGDAWSAAGFVALGGSRRSACPEARFCLHRPHISGRVAGPSEESEIDKWKQKMVSIYSSECRGRISRALASEMIEVETWLDAWEAQQLGIIDVVEVMRGDGTYEVVTRP